MEDLNNNIDKQFPSLSYEKWASEAQKTVKDMALEELLNVKLTNNFSVKAIYDKSQVINYFDLQFNSLQLNNPIPISIDRITDLTIEADLEIAVLIDLINRENIKEAEVNLQIDTNFFLSIAKFRAMRYLLTEDSKITHKLIAVSPQHNKSALDNKNNLIRLTTETMSALLGTADKILLNSYNSLAENDDFGKRITENIKLILDNESHLSRVSDPLAGSYLVENITSAIIESVRKYREELKRIATEDELKEYVTSQATNYSQHLKSQLDSQQRKLIGVNIFQNPKDILNENLLNPNSFVNDYEVLNAKIGELRPKAYIANFNDKNPKQISIAMALNTFNVQFQASEPFELVEDAFNSIKLYDPDLVILNSDDNIRRNLTNMLGEYAFADINDFSDNSMTKNINILLDKIKTLS